MYLQTRCPGHLAVTVGPIGPREQQGRSVPSGHESRRCLRVSLGKYRSHRPGHRRRDRVRHPGAQHRRGDPRGPRRSGPDRGRLAGHRLRAAAGRQSQPDRQGREGTGSAGHLPSAVADLAATTCPSATGSPPPSRPGSGGRCAAQPARSNRSSGSPATNASSPASGSSCRVATDRSAKASSNEPVAGVPSWPPPWPSNSSPRRSSRHKPRPPASAPM